MTNTNTNYDSLPKTIGESAERAVTLHETDVPNLQDILNGEREKIASLQKQFEKCNSNLKKSKSIIDELSLASKNLHSFSSKYSQQVSYDIHDLEYRVSYYEKCVHNVGHELSMCFYRGGWNTDSLEDLKKESFDLKNILLYVINNKKSLSDRYKEGLGSSFRGVYRDFKHLKDNIDGLISRVKDVERWIKDNFEITDKFLKDLEANPIHRREYLSRLLTDYRAQCAEEKKQTKAIDDFLEELEDLNKGDAFSKLIGESREQSAEEETSRQDENKDDIPTVISKGKDSEKVSCETTMSNLKFSEALGADLDEGTVYFCFGDSVIAL